MCFVNLASTVRYRNLLCHTHLVSNGAPAVAFDYVDAIANIYYNNGLSVPLVDISVRFDLFVYLCVCLCTLWRPFSDWSKGTFSISYMLDLQHLTMSRCLETGFHFDEKKLSSRADILHNCSTCLARNVLVELIVYRYIVHLYIRTHIHINAPVSNQWRRLNWSYIFPKVCLFQFASSWCGWWWRWRRLCLPLFYGCPA